MTGYCGEKHTILSQFLFHRKIDLQTSIQSLLLIFTVFGTKIDGQKLNSPGVVLTYTARCIVVERMSEEPMQYIGELGGIFPNRIY